MQKWRKFLNMYGLFFFLIYGGNKQNRFDIEIQFPPGVIVVHKCKIKLEDFRGNSWHNYEPGCKISNRRLFTVLQENEISYEEQT